MGRTALGFALITDNALLQHTGTFHTLPQLKMSQSFYFYSVQLCQSKNREQGQNIGHDSLL